VSKLIEPPLTANDYEELARAYYETLPLEHFMEANPQATQRMIAVNTLGLLSARRPDVQLFNELLIQYWTDDELRRVVPDNMVRLCDQPLRTEGSYNTELEPVGPLWILEWVADSSEGKDYGDAFRKYERDLKIPYCLSYHPGKGDLRFYRHNGKRYERVEMNTAGRYPLPELDLEIGRLEGWVRFWHLGELLDLPADWQKRRDQLEAGLTAAKKDAEQEKRHREADAKRAEQERAKERMRAEQQEQLAKQERARAEQERMRAEQQEQLAKQERSRAEQQEQLAKQERSRAEQERARAEQEHARAEQARVRAEAAEAELAKLRARLGEDKTGT